MRGLFAAALVLASWPAQAQSPCFPTLKALTDQLEGEYGEVLIGRGLTTGGLAIWGFYVSPLNNTWSLIRTMPNGESCLIAVGDSWMDEPPPEPGDPA